MPQITDEECIQRVSEFLDAHLESYTDREIAYIRRNYLSLRRNPYGRYTGDVLRQIYDELDLYPTIVEIEQTNSSNTVGNMYDGFVKLLEENFDIDRDIVEVAGGVIPTLAKKIALKQKNGTITVYDPRLMHLQNLPANLILEPQSFRSNTPIPTAKMIISFMPCEATPTVITSARQNKLDFMIGLCEGGTRKNYEWLETTDEWLGYMTYLAERTVKENDLGTLAIESLEKYGNPYPVIYNKRRKS